jgi:hypothetical protein
MKFLVVFILFASTVSAQTVDKKFVISSAFLVASSIYDNESTFHALKNCPTCREANPIMAPFVKRGRLTTYAVTAAVDTALIYWSYKLKQRHSKLWWIVPAEVSVGHTIAATFNMRF